MFTSPHHIEVTPTEMGNMDRVVIQDIIKEFSSSRQILESPKKFKAVIIFEADYLSKDAQNALRRTMERFARNVKFIFIVESLSMILAPLRSRCLCLRCPSVTPEIFNVIAPKVQNSHQFVPKYGSLRRNIMMFDMKDPKFWWEKLISNLSVEISNDKFSPNSLSNMRSILTQIMSGSISKREIVKVLLNFIIVQCLLMELLSKSNLNLDFLFQIVQLYVYSPLSLGFSF
jgi:hypothetical protein